jgi:hypothetical protein
VYVDDLVITGADIEELKQFKKEMQDTFQMADLGLLRYYLGLEVKQDDSGVTELEGVCFEDPGRGKHGRLQPEPHSYGESFEAE